MLTLYGARIVCLEKDANISHNKTTRQNLKRVLLVDFFR